jgi:hypothetical protein
VKIKEMNLKTKTLTLLSVIIVASVAGSFVFALQSAKADTTTSVAEDSETALSSINATDNESNALNGFAEGSMTIPPEHRFGMGNRGMSRGFDRFYSGAIQVSSEFIANVTSIANADTDIQNLLNQGYNITSIRPVISTTIDGNGNVVTKASSADLTLLGTNGRAFAVVDIEQAKVSRIVTLTITEINK